MEVLRYDDPAAFHRDGAPVLLADAGRNNLILGVLQVLLDEPDLYPVFHLWLAARDGRPAGLAMQTEPFNVIVAEPLEAEAVDALAEAVVADGGPLPGVIANRPWADRFAEHVSATTGRGAERILEEGVWMLTAVEDVPAPRGAARAATPTDRDLVRTWIRAFADEALPAGRPQDDEARRDLEVDLRLAGRGAGYLLWEDGSPVSLSGHREIPGVGSRIGPVYTPPQQRGRGYATRLVAEHSASRLAAGDAACYLYTDMANPTSNAIYARIGYVKIGDAAEYMFGNTR
jgi:GNAT superfamily N-acetyltransferase